MFKNFNFTFFKSKGKKAGKNSPMGQQGESPEWSSVFQQLKDARNGKGCVGDVHIPITKDAFKHFNYSLNAREINRIIEQGYIRVDSIEMISNIIKLSYCIDNGSDADEDGYGMSPREDIFAVLDLHGNFVAPFELNNTSKELATIDLLIERGLPALDEHGNINARFEETADKWHTKVFIGDLCGMFSFDRLEVPCSYKNVELMDIKHEWKSSYCVQTPEGRFGFRWSYSKEEDIPAIWYSPFEKVGDRIVSTTRQDGSKVYLKIPEDSMPVEEIDMPFGR